MIYKVQDKTGFVGHPGIFNLGNVFGTHLAFGIRKGLVAWWNLDEESGTRFDSSGNGLHLTDNNQVGVAEGKIGNAADFVRADNQWLDNRTNDQPNMPNWTMVAWLWRDDWTSGGSSRFDPYAITDSFDEIESDAISMRYIDGNLGHSRGADESGDHIMYDVSGKSGWVHQVIRQSRTGANAVTVENIVDADFAGSKLATDQDWADLRPAGFMLIGGLAPPDNTSFQWQGRVDLAGLWNRALTDAEIDYLWNNGNGRTLF